MTTPTDRLSDLTHVDLLKPPYIEGGRLKWESKSAGSLIQMFAAGGYDVITPDDERDETRNPSRLVKDQQGHIVAWSADPAPGGSRAVD